MLSRLRFLLDSETLEGLPSICFGLEEDGATIAVDESASFLFLSFLLDFLAAEDDSAVSLPSFEVDLMEDREPAFAFAFANLACLMISSGGAILALDVDA